jgi:4-hydroxy-3-methylbut-2-enyl diphosphate reductase
VLSAHGVAPEVYANARQRHLNVIDATCPLVTKVHLEARRFAREGRTIMLIGHEGHEEVVGTTGEAPARTVLVQSPDEARTVKLPDELRNGASAGLGFLTQTTLSVDETNEIIDVLRERFPHIEGPPREDICYATQNRQDAVKDLARESDVILVIGSNNSSNSKRLVEVSRSLGTPAHLIDDESEIDPGWIEGAATVGVTSGASAPEWLVERVLSRLEELGAGGGVDELHTVEESMRFSLPAAVRS